MNHDGILPQQEVTILPQQESAVLPQQDAVVENNSLGNDTGRRTIPVIEEQVVIEKKIVETAKVHISKVVYEDVDQYTIPFTEEHVAVERVPKNIYVDTMPPAVRYEGDVMIIPVLKEVAVVEKRIMLVEELHVTKYQTQKSETYEISLRKEEVQINRTEANTSL